MELRFALLPAVGGFVQNREIAPELLRLLVQLAINRFAWLAPGSASRQRPKPTRVTVESVTETAILFIFALKYALPTLVPVVPFMTAVAATAVAGSQKSPLGVIRAEFVSTLVNITPVVKEKFRRRLRPARGAIPP